MDSRNQALTGVAAALAAYVLWGFLPLYWNMTSGVPPAEVLAHRVIWSLAFMAVVLLVIRKGRKTIAEVKQVFSKKKTTYAIIGAAFFISLNWLTFIFSVQTDRVIEASLGYYINPLISVVLGVLFLKEKLSRAEQSAVLLAAIGVFMMSISYGYFPWAAFVMAISFGVYGLLKKMIPIGAWTSIAVETLLVTPFALIYLAWVHMAGGGAFGNIDVGTNWVLIGAGAATAIPLILFSAGARRISLTMIGFLQYIAPTSMLILGVFVFGEPFSSLQFVSFCIVWAGLLLFTTVRTRASFLTRKMNHIAQKSA